MQIFTFIETDPKEAVQNVSGRIRVNRVYYSRALVINRSYQHARVFLDTRYFGMNSNYFAVPAHSQTLVSEIVSSSWIAFVAKGCPEFSRTVDIVLYAIRSLGTL